MTVVVIIMDLIVLIMDYLDFEPAEDTLAGF